MEDILASLDRRITALETRDAVSEVHHETTMKRLDSIEDTLKWLVRLVIGGLLMAAVGYAVNGGFA